MKTNSFDAQVTAALFDKASAVFALGDGSVRFEGGEFSAAHDGAILCAAVHPSGDGVITGGDDGRVIWHRRGEAGVMATAKGQWIDAIDASAESGLIAFSAGKTLSVIDAKDAGFRRDFVHERTVSGVAFEPKGRRIATSTYGGAALWFGRIAEQKPTFLKWAGSHTAVTWSPDGWTAAHRTAPSWAALNSPPSNRTEPSPSAKMALVLSNRAAVTWAS